jgi:NADH-quinone oxidoreductase subunit L
MTGAFSLAWIVLLLPLVSAALITLFTLKNDKLSAKISIGAVIGGFVLSLLIFLTGGTSGEHNITWISIGDFQATLGVRIDALSSLMLLVVTGVGSKDNLYKENIR